MARRSEDSARRSEDSARRSEDSARWSEESAEESGPLRDSGGWRRRLRFSSDDEDEDGRRPRVRDRMAEFLRGRVAPKFHPIKERVTQQLDEWTKKMHPHALDHSAATVPIRDPFADAPSVDEMIRLENERLLHFTELLTQPRIDLNALRAASRRGIPFDARAQVWQVLLGYIPCEAESRERVVREKRDAYKRLVLSYMDVDLDGPDRTPKRTLPFEEDAIGDDIFSSDERVREAEARAALFSSLPPRLSRQEREKRSAMGRLGNNGGIPHTLRMVLELERWGELCDQIHVDVIRTVPQGYEELFLHPCLLNALARVLFLFSIIHHEGNYWQGLNEIPIPFFITFLSFATGMYPNDLNSIDDVKLQNILVSSRVEADVYWCLCSFVVDLQKHDFAIGANGSVTPKAMLSTMDSVLKLTNPRIFSHLEKYGLELIFYAFRWMVCLLIREMPSLAIVRLWDTYIADPGGVTALHPCVCTALLHLHRQHILQLDTFEEILMYLQKLPTASWTERETSFMVNIALEYEHQLLEVQMEARRALERVLVLAITIVTAAIVYEVARRMPLGAQRAVDPSAHPDGEEAAEETAQLPLEDSPLVP